MRVCRLISGVVVITAWGLIDAESPFGGCKAIRLWQGYGRRLLRGLDKFKTIKYFIEKVLNSHITR